MINFATPKTPGIIAFALHWRRSLIGGGGGEGYRYTSVWSWGKEKEAGREGGREQNGNECKMLHNWKLTKFDISYRHTHTHTHTDGWNALAFSSNILTTTASAKHHQPSHHQHHIDRKFYQFSYLRIAKASNPHRSDIYQSYCIDRIDRCYAWPSIQPLY